MPRRDAARNARRQQSHGGCLHNNAVLAFAVIYKHMCSREVRTGTVLPPVEMRHSRTYESSPYTAETRAGGHVAAASCWMMHVLASV